MNDRSGWPTEVDYAWADGWGVGYCIALIEGVAPEVVLDLLVPDPPTGIVPVDAAWEWAEDERARATTPQLYATTIEAGVAGGWTVAYEDNGYLATLPGVIGPLSLGSRAVVLFRNVNAHMSFTYAVDGEVVRVFDPLLYADPTTGETLPEESGLPFGVGHADACAMACAERITGVRLTEEMLEQHDNWVAVGHYPSYSGPGARSWREAKAEAERQAELERERAERLQEERIVRDEWGGRAPSDRLRHVGGNVWGLVRFDRDLLDALAEADPAVQRAIARWAARRALTVAGLAELDWVAPALEALDAGQPLPPPFDDVHAPFGFLQRPGQVLRVVSTISSGDSPPSTPRRIDPRYAALPTLRDATEPDPLRAAINVLYAAGITFGDDHPRLFAEVRTTFLGSSADPVS